MTTDSGTPVPSVASVSDPVAEVDPWDRWGWLMFAVWLVFLGFPLTATLDPELETWQNLVGVVAVLAYGAVYLAGYFWAQRSDRHHPWWHLAAMVALIGVTWTVIGIEALGMSPFVVSLAMFTTTLRAATVVSVATLASCLALPPLFGQPILMLFAIIVGVVAVGTGTVRVLEGLEEDKRSRDEEARLMAERDRVARDVHDVLGHSLTVVTVKAELAERLVEADPDRAQVELREIQSLTRQALAEIRATVAGLRVARLSDELDNARQALDGAGIHTDVDVDVAEVDPRHRIVLAWALRESVTNVVRHSRGTHCAIALGEDWLRVTDDGQGSRGRREGNGLRGLRERVAAAGGTVDLTEPEGGGTVVLITMGARP